MINSFSMPKRKEPTKPIPEWAKRLAWARGFTGLKKHEFAREIGIEAPAYRRYERGETQPSVDTWIKIRNRTGISLDTIIAGEPLKTV